MHRNHETDLTSAIREVMRRASFDAEFRALALKDGDAAIAAASGRRLGPHAPYRFVDNSGPVKTVVLPDFRSTYDELNEAELEEVAGGCDVTSCPISMS